MDANKRNEKVWKQKHLMGRDVGRGVVSLFWGRFKGDLCIRALLLWELLLSLLH